MREECVYMDLALLRQSTTRRNAVEEPLAAFVGSGLSLVPFSRAPHFRPNACVGVSRPPRSPASPSILRGRETGLEADTLAMDDVLYCK
jgi:hypothetical protein